MKLLAISEHYFPRVGGTVNYVHETLSALSALGVEAELLVPGPMPEGWLPESMNPPPYRVRWIDAGYPTKGDPSRKQRYEFCHKVDRLVAARLMGPDRPDILHLLFGLFMLEVLNTRRLREQGLACFVTVHNVPPMECGRVSHNAPLFARCRERLRLRAVAFKNKARLKKYGYDLYIVDSEQVHELLNPIVDSNVDVIALGPTGDLQELMRPPVTRRPAPGAPLRLLTAGGYAPHKRQHLIPQIAVRLGDAGLDFEWDVVGPSGRVEGYFDGVLRAVIDARLEDSLRIRSAVTAKELAVLYDAAHLYIQPSVEEGFCITALDAAAAGLPVIASPAGALAQISEVSGGMLVASATAPLSEAIIEFVQGDRWGDTHALTRDVRAQFSWDAAAVALCARYNALIQNDTSAHA